MLISKRQHIRNLHQHSKPVMSCTNDEVFRGSMLLAALAGCIGSIPSNEVYLRPSCDFCISRLSSLCLSNPELWLPSAVHNRRVKDWLPTRKSILPMLLVSNTQHGDDSDWCCAVIHDLLLLKQCMCLTGYDPPPQIRIMFMLLSSA